MNRLLVGVALGAALVYFFDSERGDARRQSVSDWARQYVNEDTVQQARQATQATVQQAKSLSGQVTDQVNQIRSGRRSSTTTGANGVNSATLNNSSATSTSAKL